MEVLLFNLYMTTFQIIEYCVNKCLGLLHERDDGSTAIQSVHDNIDIYFR